MSSSESVFNLFLTALVKYLSSVPSGIALQRQPLLNLIAVLGCYLAQYPISDFLAALHHAYFPLVS